MSCSRFIVGITGGVGSGKKKLAETILKNKVFENRVNVNICRKFEKQHYDFKIFIDKPVENLMVNYVVGLENKVLLDRNQLLQKLQKFQEFHKSEIQPNRKFADFYIENVEDENRLNDLNLSILSRMKSGKQAEPKEVQMYIEMAESDAKKGQSPKKISERFFDYFKR